jgi:intracellular septation protein|tara:strand:+ start:655 stop:1359 length:705 start_codon:yes stop_codon:yes gene_type:complete
VILLHQLAKADTFLQIYYDDHPGVVFETGSDMKQFIDYIPLLIFFTVWAMDERSVTIGDFEHSVGGIFSAAEFLLAGSILVYGCLFAAQRRLDKFQWITVAAVVLFCIPTIIFRDTNFLKWKAPIVNWIFATVFIVSRYIGDKPAIEHMMGHAVEAPKELWTKLNTIWVYYFVVLGAINLAVAFTLSEALWIQFKVFGNLILTFGFVLGQMPLLAKYIEVEEEEADPKIAEEQP